MVSIAGISDVDQIVQKMRSELDERFPPTVFSFGIGEDHDVEFLQVGTVASGLHDEDDIKSIWYFFLLLWAQYCEHQWGRPYRSTCNKVCPWMLSGFQGLKNYQNR